MKKYFAAFVLLAFAAIFVTVFCLVSFKPLDTLMKPPSSSGENLEIQRVFEEHIGHSYKLRSPLKGDYRSSFVFEDINNDREEEVFVFYSSEDSLETVRLCYISKVNGEWGVVSDIESPYNEIQKIDFADINGDGILDVLVGWANYQNDLTRNMYVYSVGTDSPTFKILYNCAYSEFEIIDIDRNYTDDIIVFNSEASSGQIYIDFLTFDDGEIFSKDMIYLDASVYSVKSVSFDTPVGRSRTKVYVDAYKTDSGIVTECIYWNPTESSLTKLSTEDGSDILSTRMSNISCEDINSDGKIEVPVEIQLEGSRVITAESNAAAAQSIIKWVQFTEESQIEISKRLIYNNNDFSVLFSDLWIDNITVRNNYKNGSIYFYKKSDEKNVLLFELKYISTQDEEEALSEKYRFLTDTKKGKLFCIIYNYDSSLSISRAYIENSIVK